MQNGRCYKKYICINLFHKIFKMSLGIFSKMNK